ncbi:amino acid adenylation domain-containing protein [Kitasatospora sp. MAA4]|uniref:amino acid adenylation domain-containing protein n=1 Tax=Kitasatospora sp. MAA4 TaxID=3035093 RepID=UPI002476A4D7|nr:amino acid adenylation domain-containing protein [Kitasatospora sp. MAA4]MDH6133742.1 amino acid adenylation domain-containing protein [Kitasatospora sp. MAA4]
MITETLSITHGPAPAPAPGEGAGPLDWFDSWLARQPDAPAVVDGPAVWSYRELDAAAERLAVALCELVEPGELVGVCLERSPLLVAAAVAVARIGAVYLPLGAQPGQERLRALTEDAGIGCLLTDGALAPPSGWSVQPVDGLDGAGVAVRPPGPETRISDAFYAVTTSGSTGRPKIVLVPERALVNLVGWTCDRLDLGPGARVSLLIGTTFDPHLKELWSALCSGAALHVAPQEARGSTAELFQWWRESSITHCILPTPLAELAFARPWPEGLALTHLSVGGDRMRVRPPADCTATVHNMYGPAEATVVTTTHEVGPATDGPAPAVPIGLPMSGVTVLVTDPDGRLLPRGEAGELRIGGAGLALGYLDPQRTAERFGPAPAEQGVVDRVYLTGDKVVMRADGLLEFLGRLDDQVKISGARIEPAEVEAALEAHPSVRHAVVVAVPGAGGGLRLAAFLWSAEGAAQDRAAVLQSARARLIEQAVPAVVRFVDEFPLNANGKVDRTLLAGQVSPTAAEQQSAKECDGAGDTELFLLATCRQLLDQNGLALDDNFATAGGTSLAAARLLAAIESTYRIRVKAAEVMRQPDLRTLAALIATRRSAASAQH